MFGPPKDVEGKCNARLFLADDYGDNNCTIMCQLEPNHFSLHKETFMRTWLIDGRRVVSEIVITWQEDEKPHYSVVDEE